MVVELAPAGSVPADLTDDPELPDRFPLAQADPTGDPVRVAVARPVIVAPAVDYNVILTDDPELPDRWTEVARKMVVAGAPGSS